MKLLPLHLAVHSDSSSHNIYVLLILLHSVRRIMNSTSFTQPQLDHSFIPCHSQRFHIITTTTIIIIISYFVISIIHYLCQNCKFSPLSSKYLE